MSQLREEIRRLNVALVQCQDIKTIDFETGNHHFHASRQTNGVSGGKRMTDELKGTLPTTLASSDSNPSGGLFSSSSPSLISCSTSVSSSVELEAKDIDNCVSKIFQSGTHNSPFEGHICLMFFSTINIITISIGMNIKILHDNHSTPFSLHENNSPHQKKNKIVHTVMLH